MKKQYAALSTEELALEYQAVLAQYEQQKQQNLKLDMSRGKPGAEQLDLVTDLLTVLTEPEDCIVEGVDVRNYGEVSGLPCAKRYWADVLGCKPEETFVGGNSSLNLMYDVVSKAYTHGWLHSEKPWCKLDRVKWICPVPGYDRHFKITESFGAEMITVPMLADGPDMDQVEKLIKDPEVKGMWCVPKFSNPDGIVFSDEVVHRIASMKPAAPDFLLMWDNAYCVHEFEGEFIPFEDILTLCREAGNPDMVVEFASTSKVTMPGAGFSVMAASKENIAYATKLWSIQTISYDKVNQLRHVLYLKDKAHTLDLMKKHAKVMQPKFKTVLDALDEEIAPLGIASWKRPVGGYFISLNTTHGLAKRTLALCAEAGVVMTGAGATFPYGKDPYDSNIRIAPSLPPVKELEQAISILCTCLKLAALEQRMGKRF